jgi:hypothetical protein
MHVWSEVHCCDISVHAKLCCGLPYKIPKLCACGTGYLIAAASNLDVAATAGNTAVTAAATAFAAAAAVATAAAAAAATEAVAATGVLLQLPLHLLLPLRQLLLLLYCCCCH